MTALARPVDSRRGSALLEVLAAAVLLGVMGSALAGSVLGALEGRQRAALADRRIIEADQAMQEIALLPRRELERRLGRHTWRSFEVEIQRPERSLFHISVYEDSLARAPVLATVLSRNLDSR